MLENKIVISDTTPLIALEKIDEGYSFLKKLYDFVLVPRQVLEELSVYEGNISNYLIKHKIEDFLIEKNPQKIPEIEGLSSLDDGEKYAIALAVEEKLPILIHEKKGRKVAKQAQLEVSGIPGQVLIAHIKQIISKTEAVRIINQLYKVSQINKTIHKKVILAIESI